MGAVHLVCATVSFGHDDQCLPPFALFLFLFNLLHLSSPTSPSRSFVPTVPWSLRVQISQWGVISTAQTGVHPWCQAQRWHICALERFSHVIDSLCLLQRNLLGQFYIFLVCHVINTLFQKPMKNKDVHQHNSTIQQPVSQLSGMMCDCVHLCTQQGWFQV